MKISFLGLSSFLIENSEWYTVLVDPYDDTPKYTLWVKFPKTIQNKPLWANILLISEPDPDHAKIPETLLPNAKSTKPKKSPFPWLNLKWTIVYEYNWDVNICYSYTVDGLRIAHFADHAHTLTDEQIQELWELDIITISPPKCDYKKIPESIEQVLSDIQKLNPKLVIFSHHIAPDNMPFTNDSTILRKFFSAYLVQNASTNIWYKDLTSFIELSYIYENAHIIWNRFNDFQIIDNFIFETDKKQLDNLKQTKFILFNKMCSW